MIKYAPLDAIINYIPQAIRRDTDLIQIKSWALQAYRQYNLPFQYEIKYVVVDVTDHKVVLPDDVVRLVDIRYNPYYPDDNITTIVRDYGDYRLIIAQEIFFGSSLYANSRPLKYLGQNRSALIDESMYCDKCEVGFSIDHSLTCLTIDVTDGSIIIGYLSMVRDENDSLLVPDHPDLFQGLSHYVQAQYWLDKSYTHTENAFNFHTHNSVQAERLLNRFKSRRLMASLNADKHNMFVFGRNVPNYNYERNTYIKR